MYYGGSLQYMAYNGQAVYFTHAPDGTPMGMLTEGNAYFYITNLQGDVVALLNSSGMPVVQYTYDAWGNLLGCTGSLASTIGALNPIRYRGYVYDTETQLYYLQSRYYDPEIGRFINADAFASTGQGFTGNNMFAYCLNNPTNRIDYNGEAAIWYWLIVNHDMGLVHRLVQDHIRLLNPGIITEATLGNNCRADIVSTTGAVWEIKHQGTNAAQRQTLALAQANSYIGQTTTKTRVTLTHLGNAYAFEGSFILPFKDSIYQITYYTPQDGVVLYCVDELFVISRSTLNVYATREPVTNRIANTVASAVTPVGLTGGAVVLTGLFSSFVNSYR